MLSAVAARRAAQAQAQAAQPSAADNHTAQPGISSAKTFVSAKPPSKKRKPSASAGPPPSRTLKKQKAKANVVFETPIASTPFRSRASPPTNSEDDERAWSDAEEWTGAQSEVEDALPTALVQGQRTWSPSRPLVDSSDEEEIAAGPSTHRSVPVRGAPPETKVLSTFVPQLNVNTFTLSPSEQDSLFPPSASEAKSRAAVALIVREEETLCLLGMYTLSILRGRVTISGATLAASSIEHRVFAPRSSPLPVIHHVPFSPERLVQPRIPDRIHDRLGAGDALVVLRELRTGVEALGDICPPFSGVFRRSARDAEPAHDLGIPGVQLVHVSSAAMQPLVLPPSWQSSLDLAVSQQTASEVDAAMDVDGDPPVYLVRGPKKTGKSTFARTLINRLFNRYRRVAFLECDLGQSEFTPAGMVALSVIGRPVFGPPFTHPTVPHLAHYVGATTPRDTPAQYLASVAACLQTYRLDVARCADLPPNKCAPDDPRISDAIPLVVNTMGWTKGLGADLNTQVTDMAAPTRIFALSGFAYPDRLGHALADASAADAHGLDHGPVTEVLEPVSTALSAHHTPVDHRALSILSYFHAVFPGPSTSEDARNLCATHWTPVSLIARAPYDVDWAAAFPGGLAIAAPGGEDVIPSEVARVLPGAVVALVAATFDTPSGPAAGTTEWGYVQGAQPSPPSSSHCVGLALVRGVCPRAPPAAVEPGAPGLPVEGARAQLLTPLPPTLLGAANCAVKGALELPLWGWLGTPQAAGGGDSVAGWPRVRVPFLRWPPDARRTDGVPSPAGAERRRVRRNLMRRGQL